ncbi:hypothetical protein M9H77_18107 [Catharanthus roseus]|uniref:Uncharacterized protein n=1 Tax=Catharanthus roseus TaxID=4058 RepID=A0ACC0B6I0_CATRO|nr:hypothetical protein M9H77_18107 [Catharanthus roseus]
MFSSQISSERSGAQQATEVLGQEFLDQIFPEGHMFMFYLFRLEPSVEFLFVLLLPRGMQMPYSAAVDLVAELGTSQMAHPSHRWTYRESTLVDEPSRTMSSSSSSYSLREIVPEKEPIPVIDLSDNESVERPEIAPVPPGIGLRISIEEDPSEPTSDSEMMPEPEGVAPADIEALSTFTAGGSPLSVSPICGYCLWREQWAGAASQQVVVLREEISRMDALFYAARQARLIDTDKNKTRQFVKGFRIELQRALAPLPPMGFAAAVEAATRTELADQAVIQRKTTIGSAATPYKRPGQGPWKPRDFKRSRSEQRT